MANHSNTTISDIPIEVVEEILIRAISLELIEAKILKAAWTGKADRILHRLSQVCLIWDNILSTNLFRKRLRSYLKATAQDSIRWEIRRELTVGEFALEATTLNNEIMVLWRKGALDFYINVYDQRNLETVKDVISLQGRNPSDLQGCVVSACMYALNRMKSMSVQVLRIARNDEQKFEVSVVCFFPYLPNPTLSLGLTGNLILSGQQPKTAPFIRILDPSGSSQKAFRLASVTPFIRQIVEQPNGNMVLVAHTVKTKLMEIDLHGNVLNRYIPSDSGREVMASQANIYGQMVLVEQHPKRLVVLDSEFNLVDLTGPPLDQYNMLSAFIWHYNIERNEILAMLDTTGGSGSLSILGFV